MLLGYAKAQDPQQVKQALDPAKGEFKLVTDEKGLMWPPPN
jgi:hypothetical protein